MWRLWRCLEDPSQDFPRQSERSGRRAWVSSDEVLSINYVLKSGVQMSATAVDQAIGYDVTIIEKWEKVFPLFCSHIPGVFGPGEFHLQKRSYEIRQGQWPKKRKQGPRKHRTTHKNYWKSESVPPKFRYLDFEKELYDNKSQRFNKFNLQLYLV